MRKIVHKKTTYSDSSLRTLIDNIRRGDDEVDICGLQESAKSFISSLLFRDTGKNLLFITPSRKEALDAFRDLTFFLGDEDVLFFPPRDIVTPDNTLSRQNETATCRARVLARLLSTKPVVIVADAKMRQVFAQQIG